MGGLRFVQYHAHRRGAQMVRRWRASSDRVIALPPSEGIGVGNMFTFWLWAHHGRLIGEDRWVRHTEAMEPWLEVFPQIRPLLIAPDDMRLRDRRDPNWYQQFDAFPYESMRSFIDERLLSSAAMQPGADDLRLDDPGRVLVNVRRGDYYSNPNFRRLYGFDIAAYVQQAMLGASQQGSITGVYVVSDDPAWCEAHLGFLAQYGPVRYAPVADGPVANLRDLAAARRLVLANSTFSYWGAYVSNVRYGDNFELTWAPEFHRRDINDGKAYQLDPRWSVIEGVPDDLGSASLL